MYSGVRSFRKHKQMHEEEKTRQTYDCPHCNKKFKREYQLTEHVADYHEGRKSICTICCREFSTVAGLRFHMNTHKRSHMCEICLENFPRQSALSGHMLNGHQMESISCSLCQKVVYSEEALQQHISEHDLIYVCDICGKGFAKNSSRIYHMSYVHNRQQMSCKVCGKIFSSTSGLRGHLAMHNRTFECKYCLKTFQQGVKLHRHIIQKHEQPLQCSTCKQAFKGPKTLEKHLQMGRCCTIASTHQEKKPCVMCGQVACTRCGKAFGSKRSLRRHFTDGSCQLVTVTEVQVVTLN